MRTYNVVRPKFWAWAVKEKGLSPPARELALYLLTCEHVNGTGCYRLPVAYIADDLGTVPATVRKTVGELAAVGFLRHDDATGWLWLPGFLDHNPIANGNVGKSLAPFVCAVPRGLSFYGGFLDSLERANVAGASGERRLPAGLIERLRNGMPNGSANGMPTHEHEHEHEHGHGHEHEHDQEHDHVAGAGDEARRTAEQSAQDEQAAFDAWNAAAERVGRWPTVRKLEADRRKAIRARIKSAGSLAVFLEVLAKAEGSRFCREDMSAFAFDWFLKPANFRKVSEGNFDDKRGPAAPAGRVDVLQDVVGAFRRKEQAHGELQ